MDSFFKAAVCDLDKLLDDFELNTEELECRPVFLKPSSFPFSSLSPNSSPSESSPVPSSLPDLSSLHYGSAPSADRPEVRGQPLTGVDLLSSVDRPGARSSAPPCPDRTLKPVCDLVSDTSSAILVRANSHDAFSELDAAERLMEEEEEEKEEEKKEEEEEEEVLLVDFDEPAEERGASTVNDTPPVLDGGFSLSLLDVILPAAVERGSEDSPLPGSTLETTERDGEELKNSLEEEESTPGDGVPGVVGGDETPEGREGGSRVDGEQGRLSCLPLAVSICAALVNQDEDAREEEEEEPDVSDSVEADFLCAGDGELEERRPEERDSPEGQQQVAVQPAAIASPQPSPPDSHEFGFEFLPESDQAELLVTDEELDAFLRAHAEGQRPMAAGSSDTEEMLESGGGIPSDLISAQKLRMCGRSAEEEEEEEEEEHPASPESDRTACGGGGGVEGRDSSPHDQLNSPYGGARPKHSQPSHSPPPGGEEEDDEEEGRGGRRNVAEEDDEQQSPAASPAEEEQQDFGYEELSEPPPYPGETPADAVQAGEEARREGAEPGSRQPAWVPDSEAPNCMKCYQRFTFTKRRHHCRACGKVYCAACCYRRCKLKYLDKEARVCITCFDNIHKAQALERMMSPTSPNPNVPSEYCSTVPPLQQAQAAGTLNSPPPTVMVPVSVLKQPANEGCPREQKRVWFADGILPNGEVADTSRLAVSSRRSSQEFSPVSPDPPSPGSGDSDPAVDSSPSPCSSSFSAPEAPGVSEVLLAPLSGPWDYGLLSGVGASVNRVPSLLPDNQEHLPPLLILTGEEEDAGGGGGGGDVLVEESPAPCQILHLLEDGGPRPLTFVLNANLLVNVKLVTYSSRQCWCFGSIGLQALGQKEVVFLLECLPEEKTLPKDLFSLYLSIYQDAQKGKFVDELENVTFTSSFLGSKDHGGMLFFSPTCQPLDGLSLPPPPFLFGVLVQKLEVPWAKVFPLRLLLRLGSQHDVYPTALISVRFRESVYRETGHTIMNLLADLRNYQYSLSVVEGLRIHMEMGHSYIDIPKSSFNEMQKVVNSSNEHVISVGASFSPEADSHLVCFQNEDGNYQTQANSMAGKTRTVTGASFVVFNGALKASSGFIAKSSIVEDGLMVQIPPETMESLRSALREQRDFHIPCGKNDGGELRENVTVRWINWSSPVNTGRLSGVDGRPLDGVDSVRMQQDGDFQSHGRTIRCTEVFYQLKSPDLSLASLLPSCSLFQKEMAVATCSALAPHLSVLAASRINSLSLRVSTQADMVEYQAGSGGRLLPQRYMNEMDSALIPVIHGGGASVPQTAMDLEFTFYITHVI